MLLIISGFEDPRTHWSVKYWVIGLDLRGCGSLPVLHPPEHTANQVHHGEVSQ
jgi:alpha-beta hydrolase superfamily lysophospholipase